MKRAPKPFSNEFQGGIARELAAALAEIERLRAVLHEITIATDCGMYFTARRAAVVALQQAGTAQASGAAQ